MPATDGAEVELRLSEEDYQALVARRAGAEGAQPVKTPRAEKGNKYSAERATSSDGKSFHSRKERRRYEDLRLLERTGEISDLQLQVKYALEVNGLLICHYYADFKYFLTKERRWVVEDAKGFKTDSYRIKCKLMRAVHGIEILET